MKYKVEGTGDPKRRLSKSTPKRCLERSRAVMAILLQPGDTVGDARITEKVVDPDDGEIVYALDDGSWASVESPMWEIT